MFDLETAITEWRQEMSRAGLRQPKVLDELEAHLRENMERLAPEQRDQRAFQAAVQQLGDSEKLNHEFAKVTYGRFGIPRDNPIGLTILGFCFMMLGLNVILSIARMTLLGWHIRGSLPQILFLTSWCLFASQVFIGMGLLHHRHWARRCAYPLAIFQMIFLMVSIWQRLGGQSHYGVTFIYMGLMVPMKFIWVKDVLTLIPLTWGCLYLFRPEVRNLFRAPVKTEDS